MAVHRFTANYLSPQIYSKTSESVHKIRIAHTARNLTEDPSSHNYRPYTASPHIHKPYTARHLSPHIYISSTIQQDISVHTYI